MLHGDRSAAYSELTSYSLVISQMMIKNVMPEGFDEVRTSAMNKHLLRGNVMY